MWSLTDYSHTTHAFTLPSNPLWTSGPACARPPYTAPVGIAHLWGRATHCLNSKGGASPVCFASSSLMPSVRGWRHVGESSSDTWAVLLTQHHVLLTVALPVCAGAQVGVQPLGRPAELVGHALHAPHGVRPRQRDQPLHLGRRALSHSHGLYRLITCMSPGWSIGSCMWSCVRASAGAVTYDYDSAFIGSAPVAS